MTDEHMPHPHARRSGFDNFAERASYLISGAPFFLILVLLIVAWVPTLFLIKSETSHWIIESGSAILTLFLVALLQNAEKRNEEAMNLKLNAIAQGIADLMRERTGDDQDLEDNIDRLTETVGLEERTSTDRQSNEEATAARSN